MAMLLLVPGAWVHAVCHCPWCMSNFMLHDRDHAACPCPCYMPISVSRWGVHVHVHSVCPCPCCIFMSVSFYMSVSKLYVLLQGPWPWPYYPAAFFHFIYFVLVFAYFMVSFRIWNLGLRLNRNDAKKALFSLRSEKIRFRSATFRFEVKRSAHPSHAPSRPPILWLSLSDALKIGWWRV
jgi:hypothetical protein